MSEFIDATERAYREISATEPTKLTKAAAPKEPEITRAEVDDILAHKRSAPPEVLQQIIANAKKFQLTSFQRDTLGLQLSMAVAKKMREARGYREDANSRFFTDVLGLELTPMGLLYNPGWFKEELKAGTMAIEACQRHRPPSCACWAGSRARLFEVRRAFGERTPEGYAALKVWNTLEYIERSVLRAGPTNIEPV